MAPAPRGSLPAGADKLLGPACGRRVCRQAVQYIQLGELSRPRLPLQARPVATRHKPVPDAVISTAILAAGQRHCGHTDKQTPYAERKQFFHVRLLVTRVSPAFSLQTYRRALFERYPESSAPRCLQEE